MASYEALADDALATWQFTHDKQCDDYYCDQGHRGEAFTAGFMAGVSAVQQAERDYFARAAADQRI